jgi:hypothetical protein
MSKLDKDSIVNSNNLLPNKRRTARTLPPNNRLSQEIFDKNEMNLEDNTEEELTELRNKAQSSLILSDPGAFRSMDELRMLQASYHSDR